MLKAQSVLIAQPALLIYHPVPRVAFVGENGRKGCQILVTIASDG
ncbi:hypothetical protein [Lentilactobacillus otakiensis]